MLLCASFDSLADAMSLSGLCAVGVVVIVLYVSVVMWPSLLGYIIGDSVPMSRVCSCSVCGVCVVGVGCAVGVIGVGCVFLIVRVLCGVVSKGVLGVECVCSVVRVLCGVVFEGVVGIGCMCSVVRVLCGVVFFVLFVLCWVDVVCVLGVAVVVCFDLVLRLLRGSRCGCCMCVCKRVCPRPRLRACFCFVFVVCGVGVVVGVASCVTGRPWRPRCLRCPGAIVPVVSRCCCMSRSVCRVGKCCWMKSCRGWSIRVSLCCMYSVTRLGQSSASVVTSCIESSSLVNPRHRHSMYSVSLCTV